MIEKHNQPQEAEPRKYEQKDLLKQSTEEETKQKKATLDWHKKKETLRTKAVSEESLKYLKSLVEAWVLTQATAENIAEGEDLTIQEIQQIFEKIDQIESVQDIESILPKDLRITKEEYIAARKDATTQANTIIKINTALDFVYRSIKSGSSMPGLNIFTGFMLLLKETHADVVLVQENLIDIKRSISA